MEIEFSHTLFKPALATRKLLRMRCFGFVSGHDFRRAVKDGKRFGLQPLRGRVLPAMLVRREFWAEKKPRG